jgi:pyridoxal phosphate enzyme (YggS family)
MSVLDSRERLEGNLAAVRRTIERACERAGRDPADVRIVAVTKTVGIEQVRWALDLGLVDLGENYVQQLESKRRAVGAGRWHHVGTPQSRTAPRLARAADVVHGLAPGHATERLARAAAEDGRTIPALVQVDFTGRRNGVDPDSAEDFALEAAAMDGLEVQGLMTIAPAGSSPEEARPVFRRLRELRDRLRERDGRIVELSMGMSADLAVAVEEGASMVRVGTALFGPRHAPGR